MTDNNYQTPQNNQYNEESEIDILEIISKLWKSRKLIFKWCITGAMLGILIAFSLPNMYTASTTIAPDIETNSNSSMASLASMAGINLKSSNMYPIRIDILPDIVSSTPFLLELFDEPVQFERKDSVINTTLLTYMKEYQRYPWWSPVISAPFKALGWFITLFKEKDTTETASSATLAANNLPRIERGIIKALSSTITLNIDDKIGKISISAKMQDPYVVATVVNAVARNLTNSVLDYKTSKARMDIENFSQICQQRKEEYYTAQQAYANHVDANRNVVLKSAEAERERLQQEMNLAYQTYSQVAYQLEASRIMEQKAKFLFTTIEPVKIPIVKSSPKTINILFIFTFLAFCASSAWILFGKDYWLKLKEMIFLS